MKTSTCTNAILVASMSLCSMAMLAQTAQHYSVTPLVSDLASAAPVRDANLVNPWGLSRSSTGPWWVSDNGTGVSTLYDGAGKTLPLVVTIPSGDSSVPTAAPTGTIFNGDSNSFQIVPGKSAAFLFATEDGSISGWNPSVSAVPRIVVNEHGKASFKGLTAGIAELHGSPHTLLYAADFKANKVRVFDASFQPVTLPRVRDEDDRYYPAGDRDDLPFVDERVPSGYAPFNVQNIGGNIFVSYAKQGGGGDEQHGAGLGYVDAFSPRGRLLLRLEHGSWFNAPWGLTAAPTDFGVFSHDILVGNFGSGQIAAFNPQSGRFEGFLNDAKDQPIVESGLWAIAFGNGATAGPATSLYFTAGLDDEQNGLFGRITAVENFSGNDR